MISKIAQTFTLSIAENAAVLALKPWDAKTWDDKSVEGVKAEIYRQLLSLQSNKCCYCGLKVNETGRGEVDHIAKKGGAKRPAYVEFVFYPFNLAIACQYCNSSSKKGQEDVLTVINLADYHQCTFKIVHPYFDDPNVHYEWTNGRFRVVISGLTPEALYSIKLFELDSEAHTLARAKQTMFERKLANYQRYQEIRKKVLDILLFR